MAQRPSPIISEYPCGATDRDHRRETQFAIAGQISGRSCSALKNPYTHPINGLAKSTQAPAAGIWTRTAFSMITGRRAANPVADHAVLRHNAAETYCNNEGELIMGRLLLKVTELALLMLFIVLSAPLSGEGLDFAEQQTDIKTATRTKDDAVKRSELMKPHFANGNQAMQDAKAIRQQLQTATSDQKPKLLARMKEDYQTAITEYEQALEETEVRDENGLQVIGLIGVIRNGLVSQQKAGDMLVHDKDLPVILSNLGLAYGGVGQYQVAINTLEQAAILKPVVGTY